MDTSARCRETKTVAMTEKEFRLIAKALKVNTYGAFIMKEEKYRELPVMFSNNHFKAVIEGNRWEEVVSALDKGFIAGYSKAHINSIYVTNKGKLAFREEFKNRL